MPQIKLNVSELQIRRIDDAGGAPLVYPLSVAPKTATYPMVEADSNRCFTNAGATAAVQFTLPPASSSNVGVHFYFSVEVAQSLTIVQSGAATVRIGGASGSSIAASVVGNTIHLACTQSGKWVALSREGTWTVT